MTLESISSSSGLRVSDKIVVTEPSTPIYLVLCDSAVKDPEGGALTSQFLHQRLITPDVLDRHFGIGKLATQVVFRTERGEQGVERVGKGGARV